MKILFVAAEVAPIAKVGGMGDVVGSLPKILRKQGHDVRIFIPYYGFLPDKLDIPAEPIWWGDAMGQEFTVYSTLLPETDIPLYLFGHQTFARRNIYGDHDEYWRFTFFANGGAEFAWNYWKPDIVHCHDWHTGMIPVWMHETPDISTVFTIHNLAYRGPGRDLLQQITWCPEYMRGENAIAAALHFANVVNTVSPTYARQIQTPEYGEGLHELLSWINDKLIGIVNGIDTDNYNPATDRFIAQNFTIQTLDQRFRNKVKLQEESGLEINRSTFLVGMVSRLVEQKGIDLVLQIIDRFLGYTDAQMVILGTGDRNYESKLWDISNRHRGRISVQIVHNEALSRRLYSGVDAFLMPSRFEPCGLSQLLAMRYGAIPIVRKTGGLLDTVSFFDPHNEQGTGYCFDQYDALDLYTALIRAYEGYRFKKDWQKLQVRAMKQDFSWDKSAQKYIEIYKQVMPLVNISEDEKQEIAIAS
ncbi:glycogen synthase GlgA [Cyanobacterium aponinum UTEX 3222]|uniref:Glycogen synthase n=3 Tax=Cyanobacterium aponinum TaxID=379064 RepID=K9Z8Y2_CYAAP|nr:glycogen synthase GlgA [Cyanobacterium aponinum]WRL42952.1 glycogen synthase GlgA [Cyanobacterium aponinum UTEX 3222]AFZ55060.1 Glycogen synthase [Cyanobacterium aponinum PCC 10605]MTF39208.1 glycogen synthase GlgA [Cyanobacterium aponinum 0216]WPF88198.1 glycogen synthase GlgA [Cyanobacterium aponinum AL20115]WRL40063.1 glycogen synthase GlgA [Cyanobacterium aponinum UTEX 3221]